MVKMTNKDIRDYTSGGNIKVPSQTGTLKSNIDLNGGTVNGKPYNEKLKLDDRKSPPQTKSKRETPEKKIITPTIKIKMIQQRLTFTFGGSQEQRKWGGKLTRGWGTKPSP